MTTATYETLLALDSTRVSAEGDAVRTQMHGLFEKYGAEILVARPWDENGKLAYPIKKQKAYFYIVYYKMDTLKQAELERDFIINETVIRQLTMKIDPKWEEAILEIARNEGGSRFALKGMTDDSAPTGEGIISNDPMVMAGSGVEGGSGPGFRGPRGPRGPRPEGDKE